MDIEISRLPNGLTIVTDPMPQLESAALGVWVNCGARHEVRPLMGISHMLEHMAFKGTEGRSARDIAEQIEAVGGFLNAYTSREQTAFHARVLKSDVSLALGLLGDILTRPIFDQVELDRERQVVLQEIGQARDTPDDIIFDHLQSTIYPGQPMGWPILGDSETVSAFTREALRGYMQENYLAGGMTLVASGAVTHAQIADLAGEMFGSLPGGSPRHPSTAQWVGGDLREDDDLEQTHMAFALPGVAQTDPQFYAAQVFVTALGGGMSSRLFQEVREKRGLCYSIYAFAQSAEDGGVIGIYAGTGESEAVQIPPVVAGEMAALAAGASEAEVARAKAQLKSGLLMGLERPMSRAEQIAGQLFAHGRVLGLGEMIARLDEVDAAAVRRFGTRLLSSGRPAMAMLGPAGAVENYDTFAARFGRPIEMRAAE
ncbi:MAG TPA: pitrilysin family protein [Rhizomicrobium sp.]|jgi:predicted Zn-dependent peptidase|nr:pitrilysin family protein [Rhizomicrobium sp.]